MTSKADTPRAATPLRDFVQSLTTPRILFANLTAATIIAILNITAAVSVGALVFSGPLSTHLAMGIGLFLVGNAVTALMVPVFSGYKANIASIRTGQSPLFAAIAAGIALAMQDQPAEAVAVTAVVGILTATLLCGAAMYLLGAVRLGGFVRYIPYPVMGGFFAGLGYLTLLGGVIVAVGPVARFADPASFASSDALRLLVPAFVFATLLLVIERKITHWLLMPVYLIASALVFFAVLYASGSDLGAATQAHWLPTLSGHGESFFPVVTPDQLGLVDWRAILAQSATFGVLTMLSVIMLLLDVSGIEIVINRELDPNRELKAAGASNMIAGIAAGSLSFQSLADTAFASKLGGTRFLMIAIYVALTIAVIATGPGPIGMVPNFILGGLLIYVGLAMLNQWLLQSRRKLPLSDYLVVCAILLVVAFYGIMQGVGVGIALATLLFVHRYSRISSVRAQMIGSDYAAKTDRMPADQAYLDAHGARLRVFVLQGFLFFGTSSKLLEQIRADLDKGAEPARALAIDFARVEAMDSSAVNSFVKLMQICRREAILLALCDAKPDTARALRHAAAELGLTEAQVRLFDTLEDGVRHCNDLTLQDLARPVEGGVAEACATLTEIMGNAEAARAICDQFTVIERPAGAVLFQQGDAGDALYVVLKGSLAIVLDTPDGHSIVVRVMREGAIAGEMALYSNALRTATARVEEESVLLRLSRAAFEGLQQEHPVAFGMFHSAIVRLMADRLARANREIVALSR